MYVVCLNLRWCFHQLCLAEPSTSPPLVEPHVCGAVVIFGVCTCWLLVCMVCLHLFILYESMLVGELNSL